MGYLDKSTKTVTAHFTKKGRELLANAIAGDTSGDYIITQYALGDDEIDLKYLDQLIEKSQTKAIGFALHLASKYISEKSNTLQEVIDKIETFINKNGLDQLDPYFTENNHPGNFSRPRKYEIGAAINRLRSFSAKIID